MAYSDLISFNDELRRGVNIVEIGNFGSEWALTTSWVNIGNKNTNFSENDYFSIDPQVINPSITIKKKGLYYINLKSSFNLATASQMGWGGIFINDTTFSKNPKFVSTSYTHQDCFEAQIASNCGGFILLNEGDIITAAVSRSNFSGSLYSLGKETLRIAHVFDLAD